MGPVNLIPAERLAARRRRVKMRRWAAVCTAEVLLALIAAALTYWVVNVRRRWYAADLLAIEKEAQ